MTLTWTDFLGEEKKKPYFKTIMDFLKQESSDGKIIYPSKKSIFSALQLTPFEQVKIVILGQDPYHGPNQAHGLCFSVQPGVPPPPSLLNIYKELHADIGCPPPTHGHLEQWAHEGVLLLNTTLTVEAHKPASHAKIGWQTFTDMIISALNYHQKGIVYLLWGAHAQSKEALIDTSKHRILKAPHPSPLSAHRGFLGCRHFSKANSLLVSMGQTPVNWCL